MGQPIRVAFVGGNAGQWRVDRIENIIGAGLLPVPRVAVHEGRDAVQPGGGEWVLLGVTSHHRYVERQEKDALLAVEPGLGRPEATRAALLPITKSPAWWDLAQDERRAIFEERSHHISAGLKYLPAIARRLYHCRELGEPFDFLTWFEYAPEHEARFDELLALLRATEEWRYAEREVDIRLSRYQ